MEVPPASKLVLECTDTVKIQLSYLETRPYPSEVLGINYGYKFDIVTQDRPVFIHIYSPDPASKCTLFDPLKLKRR